MPSLFRFLTVVAVLGGIVYGVVFALAMGVFGGIFPAIRAARLPVATALREL